jgi:hypothetical protein
VHRDAAPAPAFQRAERRSPAGLVGQAGAGGPEHPRAADGVEIEVLEPKPHVGRRGLAVEQEREVIGRVQLTEDDRRAELGIGSHEAVIHPESAQALPDVGPEPVGADSGDHRRRAAQPRRGHRHVGGASAQRLGETPDLCERDAALLGVEIDAHPAHRQHIEHGRGHRDSSWVS